MSLTKVSYSLISGAPLNVIDFGASTSASAAVNTLAIQAAHDASVATGLFPAVEFPAGIYNFTTLNWSPYVQAIATGKVFLETNLASGAAIHISSEFGVYPVRIFHTQRTPVFNGSFIIENNYGDTTTAIAFDLGDSNLSSPTYGCETVYFEGVTVNYFYSPLRFLGLCHDIGFNDMLFVGNFGPQIVMTGSPVETGSGMQFYNCIFAGDATKIYTNQYLLSLDTIATCDLNFYGCTIGYLYAGLNDQNVTFVAQGTTINLISCHYEWIANAPSPWLVNRNKASFVVNGGQSSHVGTNSPATPFWSKTYIDGHTTVTNLQYVTGATTPTLMHAVDVGAFGTFDYTLNIYKSIFAPTPANVAQDGTVYFNGFQIHENVTYTSAWTATGTAPAIGNGSSIGNYSIYGKQVNLTIQWVAGSTTTFGTGIYKFELPFAADGEVYIGQTLLNGTSNTYTGIATVNSSNPNVVSLFTNASPAQGVGPLVPVTWASGNSIQIQISYQSV